MLILDPVSKLWIDDISGEVRSWGTTPAGINITTTTQPMSFTGAGMTMQQRIDQGLMTEEAARAWWKTGGGSMPLVPEPGGGLLQGERPGLQDPAPAPNSMSVSALIKLLERLAPWLVPWVKQVFRTIGPRGVLVLWAALPMPLRLALTAALTLGADRIIDTFFNDGENGADIDFTPLGPGATNGALQHIEHGANIVGSWSANGVTFYRLSDGKLAVRRKNGTVRVWRPKKPIVLYASGAKDLKTMIRADKALDKQARALAKVLSRRAPKPSSRRAARPTIVVADHHVVGQ